jgi:hypothetical protein
MQIVSPMFHENNQGMWCWFALDAKGHLLGISAQAFVRYEDARRDYDFAKRQFAANAA